jgi:hypothetical protein
MAGFTPPANMQGTSHTMEGAGFQNAGTYKTSQVLLRGLTLPMT